MARIFTPLLLACLALPGLAVPSAASGPAGEKAILLNDLIPKGSARQSSRYDIGGPESAYGEANEALAMEGETRALVDARGYAFHTKHDKNAWWTVDLGAPRLLDHARILNRVGCCQDRAATLEIYVSSEPFPKDAGSWPKAMKVFPTEDNPVGTFDTLESANLAIPSEAQAIAAALGEMATAMASLNLAAAEKAGVKLDRAKAQAAKRYVGIRLAGTHYLHLKRVEIYGWTVEP